MIVSRLLTQNARRDRGLWPAALSRPGADGPPLGVRGLIEDWGQNYSLLVLFETKSQSTNLTKSSMVDIYHIIGDDLLTFTPVVGIACHVVQLRSSAE